MSTVSSFVLFPILTLKVASLVAETSRFLLFCHLDNLWLLQPRLGVCVFGAFHVGDSDKEGPDRRCRPHATVAGNRCTAISSYKWKDCNWDSRQTDDGLPFKHSFLSDQTCKLSPRKEKWSRVMWPNWTVCLRFSMSWTASVNSQQVQMWGSIQLCFLQVKEELVQTLMLVFW